MNRPTLACLLTVALAAPALAVHAQALYRYQDATGRTVYSDQPPPASAKDVQPKRLPENVIETDPVPFAAREAAEKFPVTLYTFDCDVCRQAEGLLVKRGVPFKSVIVTEEAGAAKLRALTGKQSAPVLQVGDKEVMTGFNADRWHALLDDAGYPKAAPSPRQVARSPETKAPPAAAPAVDAVPPAGPPTPGSDYPK